MAEEPTFQIGEIGIIVRPQNNWSFQAELEGKEFIVESGRETHYVSGFIVEDSYRGRTEFGPAAVSHCALKRKRPPQDEKSSQSFTDLIQELKDTQPLVLEEGEKV